MNDRAYRSIWRRMGRWSARLIVCIAILTIAYVLLTNYRGAVTKRRIAEEMTALHIPLHVDEPRSWDEAANAYSRKRMIRLIEDDPDMDVDWWKTHVIDMFARSSSRIWAALCPGWYELELAEEIDQRLSDYRRLRSIDTDVHALRAFSEEKPPQEVAAGIRAIARTWLRWRSRIDVARAALAVKVYRVQYGRWPASLHEILIEPPLDIYTDELLRYAPSDDGVIIYSVGLNQTDEKGENSWNSENYDADDISLRLFNPELRGAKPPPESQEDETDSGYSGYYGSYPGR